MLGTGFLSQGSGSYLIHLEFFNARPPIDESDWIAEDSVLGLWLKGPLLLWLMPKVVFITC